MPSSKFLRPVGMLMTTEHTTERYPKLYAKLLRLYPKPYRERFVEGMAQTFNDLCRERQEAGEGLFALALWVFVETSVGITRERISGTSPSVPRTWTNSPCPRRSTARNVSPKHAGDRIRLNAQLVDTLTGGQVMKSGLLAMPNTTCAASSARTFCAWLRRFGNDCRARSLCWLSRATAD